MSDEFEQLNELSEKILASPQLLKALHTTSAIEYSYAWHLLRHSWNLPPEVPRDYIPHCPRLRIWDDGEGFGMEDPLTLTVFGEDENRFMCRHAVWDRRPSGESCGHAVRFPADGNG